MNITLEDRIAQRVTLPAVLTETVPVFLPFGCTQLYFRFVGGAARFAYTGTEGALMSASFFTATGNSLILVPTTGLPAVYLGGNVSQVIELMALR